MGSSRLRPIAILCFALASSTDAMAADEPVLQSHDNFQNVVRLPDGTLWRLASRFNAVYYSKSIDNGLTWVGDFTTPWKLFDTGGGLNPIPTVGPDGSLHLFQVRSDGASGLDLYHIQSNPQLTSWSSAEFIHDGKIGSMVKAITTSTGRLIAPYGDAAIAPPAGYGNNKTYVQYRDAGASTFSTSPDTLISPVPSTWNGASDGACEPTVIEKNNGSLWMLMRSQTGKLSQSTSTDGGVHWSAAVDSNFYTTSGPPCMVRMDNGDMVLLWNNATMPPKYNNKIWYGGRDVLHAAISQDDGQTWKGFREIYLDPYRNENPPTGDTGTAYPFATPTNDGKIIAITGQAAAKAQLRIDPQWLLEKNRSDDFTAANALDKWSVFKPIGDVVSTKRSRVQGAELIDDPDPLRTKPVLHVRRPDTNDPDGATWNFPSAARGTTSLRVQLQSGFAGGEIALTDRFFNPTDSQGETNAFYRLSLPASGVLPGGAQLLAGQWYDLSLDWMTDSRKAVLRVNGQQSAVLDAQAGINVWPGLSYLRLRSTAGAVDTAGFLIDSVSDYAVGHRDAKRMTSTEADAALTSLSGWTTLRFDDLVPNNNTTTSGNGNTGTFASPYTALANTKGVVLESSTGTITFADATSTQVTSDVLGAKVGETLTLRFAFPKDPAFAATVSQLALRLGSIAADNVSVKALDVDGVELPDWDFNKLPTATSSTIGWKGMVDLEESSLIHSIQFTAATTDGWFLGSFSLSPSLADLALKDLRVAGTRWTSSSGASWQSGGNWEGGIPNSATAVAVFEGAMTSGGTVTIAAPVMLNKLLLDNAASITLAGNQTLSFAGSGARLSVTQGAHTIQAPVLLTASADVNVLGGSTLTISGTVSGNASLNKLGDGSLIAGKLSVQSLAVTQGTLKLQPNGTAAGAAEVEALNVAPTAKLDLTDNALIIDYNSTDPSASIRASLITGRNGGAWNGNGICSSIAAGTTSLSVGYAKASELGISTFLSSIPLDDTTLIVRTTFTGDATLDGKVNTLDFNQLAGGFGMSGAAWVNGDFDYDGDVDSVDFNQLASNYGKTLAPSLGAIVPEPSSISVLIVGAAALPRRSRRHE